MEIIRFHAHHLNAVKKLYLESRLATFTWLDTVEFDLSDFERDTDGESIWVAVESNEVVGFVSIWAPESFIHHLFVSPNNLRGGVGLKLLDLAKQKYSNLSLKCLSQNSNATEFYLSQGFTIVETVGNGPESYHLMKWKSQT
ncbi:GNAT family N-acetyltransferase [Vibrio parahaemolyticus]|nr:GNAT family N-acetyltransferase [Vibrio parahaemolyticus]EJF9997143.1 GNAT family N-acetyltransferase [Vibrio parahaemolyticus]EJG0201038.1 GNAT family N-acetyltransferase [Vibrio parahaemolyticus]EJG0582680.1 GNAT family N-acetyltransferase [Vibrio parahaemolyticus]HCG6560690.1 GNAT family N-acetyltransferase [Vibrio parahaemolyticus]